MPRKKPEDLEPVTKKEPITYEEQKYEAEVVSNKDSTTRKVKLDLEVDTSVKDMGPNPYAKIDLPNRVKPSLKSPLKKACIDS